GELHVLPSSATVNHRLASSPSTAVAPASQESVAGGHAPHGSGHGGRWLVLPCCCTTACPAPPSSDSASFFFSFSFFFSADFSFSSCALIAHAGQWYCAMWQFQILSFKFFSIFQSSKIH